MKKTSTFIFFLILLIGGIVSAQNGPIYNEWYLHDLNVNGENVPLPISEQLGSDSFNLQITYEASIEKTKMIFFVGSCTNTALEGDISGNNYVPTGLDFSPPMGCPQNVITFSDKYNNTSNGQSFMTFAGPDGFVYEITGEGDDMVLTLNNFVTNSVAVYGLQPLAVEDGTGPLFTDWYLHELNVEAQNVPIPDHELLEDNGLLLRITYEVNDTQPELGEQTKMSFFVSVCSSFRGWGTAAGNEYRLTAIAAVPASTNSCPEEVVNFADRYNSTQEPSSFLSVTKISPTKPLIYEITGEGDDMELKITNSEGDYAVYGLQPRLSVNDISSFSEKIFIYPNPANNSFRIDLPKSIDEDAAKVSIVSSSGRLVKEFKGISNEYDISSLPSGVYMVIVKDGKNTSITKLIKQ